jgi:hypothetical protein
VAPLDVALRAVGAGAVAAVLVPGHRLGAGMVLAAAVAAVAATPHRALRSAWGGGFAVVAAGLVAVAALRDAEWVVGLCLVGALGTWSLLLSGGRTWMGVAMGAVGLARRFPAALPWVLRPLAAAGGERRSAAAPALRGAAAALVLLAVFGGLFLTADAAFRELLGRLALPAPGPLLVGQVLTGVLVTGLVAAAAAVAAAPDRGRRLDAYAGRGLRPVEWVLPLMVLDLLFTAFVTVQLTVLFGGRDHVLRTSGLTYAEYARQGFGQLVATAVLTLAVVAVCARVVPRDPQSTRLLRLLLGGLCLLTLVVLASASRRLGLYEQEFGFTRLRVSVDAAIAWLGVVLLLVLAAGVRMRAHWLPRAVLLSAAAGLLVFALADPDARIADRNVERFAATGDLDTAYLATLSLDAVPALQALPEPQRSCVLGGLVGRTGGGWRSANLARVRAAEALRGVPATDCAPAYP